MHLRRQFLVGDLSMFLRSNRFFKRDFDGSKIVSFQQASYRFLISTCYFAHLDDLRAEKMIPDLLSCQFPFRRFLIAVYQLTRSL